MVATTPVYMGVTIDSPSEVNPVVTMSNDPPKKYLPVLYYSPLLGNLAIKGLVV